MSACVRRALHRARGQSAAGEAEPNLSLPGVILPASRTRLRFRGLARQRQLLTMLTACGVRS